METNKNKVQQSLNKELTGKRLFIFIDDLDRANHEILYEFLMFLNEVVDLNRCIFIIAYDLKSAAEIIEERSGVNDGQEFLEKIINWNFNLPQPTDFDWQNLIERELKHLDQGIKKDVIDSIYDYLPKNPRKLKHFLQYLSGLHHSFLHRFEDSELNWGLLYLANLLQLEFPNEFDTITSNLDFLKLLRDAVWEKAKDRVNEGLEESENKTPKWSSMLDEMLKGIERPKRQRINLLLEGLSIDFSFLSDEDIQKNLRIVDFPELLTWKEYQELKNKFLSLEGSEKAKAIKTILLAKNDTKSVECSREFLRKLMRERRDIISNVVDESDQGSMREMLQEAHKIVEIASSIVEIDEIFEGSNPLFNFDIFSFWIGQVTEFSQFKDPIYIEKNKDEKNLSITMAKQIKGNSVSKVMSYLSSFDSTGGSYSSQAFGPIKDKIINILEPKLIKEILRGLEKPRLVKGWHSPESQAEQKIIFNPQSNFHSPEVYEKLGELSDRANADITIRQNFIDFMYFLFSGLKGNLNWVRHAEGKALFQKEAFLQLIWKAATTEELNRRTVGSWDEYREGLKSLVDNAEHVLPLPPWWEKVLKGE